MSRGFVCVWCGERVCGVPQLLTLDHGARGSCCPKASEAHRERPASITAAGRTTSRRRAYD